MKSNDLEDIEEEARRNSEFLRSKRVAAFCEVDVASSLESGLVTVVQANGIAGLQSNTISIGWPSAEEFPMELLFSMRRLDRLGKSILVLRLLEREKNEPRQLGVWWSGAKEKWRFDAFIGIFAFAKSRMEWI